ncbi:hypothetical protein P692DRAFT_2060098, partial [Suillus brevipes Sb2]
MARSCCALALLCAYLAHRRLTSDTRSQLRYWFLERRCDIISLQYTADAELVFCSGSIARPLSTREDTVLVSHSHFLSFHLLPVNVLHFVVASRFLLPPSATVFFFDSLTHLTFADPAARFMGYVHYLHFVAFYT